MKDKYIGKVGAKKRDEYEYELRMDVLGKMIQAARQERNLTQEQLGKLMGVQKSQLSKLESSAISAAIEAILKIFKALKAEINFNVRIETHFVKLVCNIDFLKETWLIENAPEMTHSFLFHSFPEDFFVYYCFPVSHKLSFMGYLFK